MRRHKSNYTTVRVVPGDQIDFHGGAIVTKDGKEIPITEEMIQASLRRLLLKTAHGQDKLATKA